MHISLITLHYSINIIVVAAAYKCTQEIRTSFLECCCGADEEVQEWCNEWKLINFYQKIFARPPYFTMLYALCEKPAQRVH